MSRNPHKAHCQVPGCHAWAMRGYTHCRPHRDAELGPRGAGAPSGNLNALRSGHHTHALTPDELGVLAQAILHDPDQLPHHLGLTVQSFHRRCHDPVKTLLALQSLIPALLSRVADELFVAELHAFRDQLPLARQGQFELSIWHHALHLSPAHKLELLHKLQDALQPPPPDADPPGSPQAPLPDD